MVVIPRDIVRDSIIAETAEASGYSVEEVRRAVRVIHDAVRENLHEHYKRCWLEGGLDYHLFEVDDEVWFAMGRAEVADDLRSVDKELDLQLQAVGASAYQAQFQSNGDTISLYRNIVEQRENPMLYPIGTTKSEEWQRGEYHVMQVLQAFVNRAEMSPAEALDYWATEHRHNPPSEWAGSRRVGVEAIQKNQRQAEEKLAENGLGSGHDVNDVRVENEEDIPEDGVYDEEEERYYVPIDGTLARDE